MSDWENEVLAVVRKGEMLLPYIKDGLVALKTDPNVADLIQALPVLAPYAERLVGLIPVIGQISSALALIDLILTHGDAIIALGAALKFAPADALNYAPFKNDTGDTGF